MKHLKILGLLAVVASALMAFTATASADVLTSPTGTTITGQIRGEAEGHTKLDNPAGIIECASVFEGTVGEHGAGKTVGVTLNTLSFGSPVGTCTTGWHVTVVLRGTLSIHGNAGTYNGTVYSTGTTLEATNPNIGKITCRYSTVNTQIGTLTGGTPATLDISANIPFHSGSIFCGSGATAWTGSYKITSPSTLLVDTT